MNQLGQSSILFCCMRDQLPFLKNMSLYIGAEFFRSETPQNIRYEHDEAAYLFTVTKNWLTECTPLRSPRRSQAQTTKEGVFWEVQVNVAKKQRKSGRLDCTRPPPTPYGRLSYVVFVVGTIENYSGGYKCQFSVKILAICHLSGNPIQTLQNVIRVLKKTEAAFYCLLEGRGGGGRGGNGMSNFIFRPRPLPLFTSLRRRWKFHNCFTCEFTAHCASKNAEMNLKSTTTNGFNFRIINSLMALAGYAWPGLTVKLTFYP